MKLSLKITLFIWMALVVSCVPISKFNEVQKKYDDCAASNAKSVSDNEQLQVSNTELNEKLSSCTNDKDSLVKDTIQMYYRLKDLQTDFNKLEGSYNDLQVAQEKMQRGNAHETNKLLDQLKQTQLDLQRREDELHTTETSLDEKRNKLDMLSVELDKRTQRMKELEGIVNRKDSAVAALKSKVSAALLGFENNGLSVHVKDGKVYVSMEEKLLFRSGSATVDKGGIDALKKLANVLEQNTDINIMIEGHTDDVPYHTDAVMKDNWDLSVKRATSIVRILLDGTSIDPKRLTAAGRGEFVPLDKAKTAEARQKNRRTEIILTPKLDELFKILDNSN